LQQQTILVTAPASFPPFATADDILMELIGTLAAGLSRERG